MGTAIVLIILITFIAIALKSVLKKKKCGGNCSGCSMCKATNFKNSLNEIKQNHL